MDDFNDLVYFTSVVEHHGFSAAARATGVEKTRLSRRIAALESRLGVRLLHRSTRRIALTEAGERFYAHCRAAVEGARSAYESVADLRREPAGTVRLTCPQVMAESYLAPILANYLTEYPKVDLMVEATDRVVDLFDGRFDLALRPSARIDEALDLVARPLADAHRILVASPVYLKRRGQPTGPEKLSAHDVICRSEESTDGQTRWRLTGPKGQRMTLQLSPRVETNDMRLLQEVVCRGLGIGLLPEPVVATAIRAGTLMQILPQWTGTTHHIYLLYHSPRGMLPSVRSLIDYLIEHLPASLRAVSNTG
ncbi:MULTISPECIES: LysR substrate-binding domain-containing protein [Marichromatium]|uniref:LysR family transcriptional regulator n=1 Tax=Marichromatium gracile TaxID=1048 RepID=A0A4V2W922_MARGR|nr:MULTISPECIES: LysR substrate-binding domain-containing protein [Marichromatium]MBK1710759.1 LysR family transcriptional regulator [Marichromatium gracile]RNE88851.1 LysR family transcriptional regulator [Marichromatium sp. AB31]TCW33207.1 LysR family transcriptional regulator [Marichromatium gracile]